MGKRVGGSRGERGICSFDHMKRGEEVPGSVNGDESEKRKKAPLEWEKWRKGEWEKRPPRRKEGKKESLLYVRVGGAKGRTGLVRDKPRIWIHPLKGKKKKKKKEEEEILTNGEKGGKKKRGNHLRWSASHKGRKKERFSEGTGGEETWASFFGKERKKGSSRSYKGKSVVVLRRGEKGEGKDLSRARRTQKKKRKAEPPLESLPGKGKRFSLNKKKEKGIWRHSPQNGMKGKVSQGVPLTPIGGGKGKRIHSVNEKGIGRGKIRRSHGEDQGEGGEREKKFTNREQKKDRRGRGT